MSVWSRYLKLHLCAGLLLAFHPVILTGETAVNTSPLPADKAIQREPGVISHPGIVAYREGQWLWSDHLFNLSSSINVDIEFVHPEEAKLDIDSEELKQIVSNVFKEAGINPEAETLGGKPPLPSFHVLVLVYPINQGYTYAVSARLFEPVQLERVKLDPSVTMQAITWDQGSIHIISKSKFKEDVEKSVRNVAQQFADRYKYFENLRLRGQQ